LASIFKNCCSLAGLDNTGRVIVHRRLRRDSVIKFSAGLAPCLVAMEARCGAHRLGGILCALGHQVRLMSPEDVRPYVKAQKNDNRDAEAIAAAATRPTMHFVELTSEEQFTNPGLGRAWRLSSDSRKPAGFLAGFWGGWLRGEDLNL
jgi:transposase